MICKVDVNVMLNQDKIKKYRIYIIGWIYPDTDCGLTAEACLIADLFQNYSTDARPRLNGSEPIELEIGHYYMSLLAIVSACFGNILYIFVNVTWCDMI